MIKKDSKTLVINRGVTFHYDLNDDYIAGIILTGAEVKSLRNGGGNLSGAWCKLENGKIFLEKFQINRYRFDSQKNHDPQRKKELLLQKVELAKINKICNEKKYQIIPVKVFVKNNLIKVKIGLGTARKKIDKRNVIKDREIKLKLQKMRRF